jgi:hypothetical protein
VITRYYMDTHRHDNFKRLAAARTNEVLRRLKILGNCSNRSHYDYSEEEVAKVFSEIDRRIREVKAKFTFPQRDKEFKL